MPGGTTTIIDFGASNRRIDAATARLAAASAEIDSMFKALGRRLPGLIREVLARQEQRPILPINGKFPAGKQRALAVESIKAVADYAGKALSRVWKCERFSWSLTRLMHRFPDTQGFGQRVQEAELDYLVSSRAASTALAENYVGLPL